MTDTETSYAVGAMRGAAEFMKHAHAEAMSKGCTDDECTGASVFAFMSFMVSASRHAPSDNDSLDTVYLLYEWMLEILPPGSRGTIDTLMDRVRVGSKEKRVTGTDD